MTPGARLAAAIEVLAEIFARSAAADRTLAAWGRAHRFAGAKDRAAIAARAYLVLRRRNECAYRMDDESARALVIGSLAIADGMSLDAIDAMLKDGAHAPGGLTASERDALARALPAGEPWVRLNVPRWLHDDLVAVFGERLESEVSALNGRAPLDLRANALKSSVHDALDGLRREQIDAVRCRYAPLGLRIAAGSDAKVQNLELFRDGNVEVQDESSQLAVLLAGARADETVIDLAAGAGGKSLALAAAMANRGRILACDVETRRLEALAERATRAGATIIVPSGNPYALQTTPADLVFVDAPCSGSGTWRRNPEAKWTLTPERLAGYRETQARLLARAAELTAPRGRMIYASCSVLPSEGRAQIEAFLAHHADWQVKPAVDIWLAGEKREPPRGFGRFASLTPAQDGTDGFFTAVLTRRRI